MSSFLQCFFYIVHVHVNHFLMNLYKNKRTFAVYLFICVIFLDMIHRHVAKYDLFPY